MVWYFWFCWFVNKEGFVDRVKKKRARRLYCADAIILRGRGYVFIERLTDPTGIALVGGKRKGKETPLACIKREGLEETGAELSVHRELGTWSGPHRDPRGPSSTTVFVASALGKLRGEKGKTRILELTEEEARVRRDEFVFDHFEIFEYFLNGGGIDPKEKK